MLIDLLNSQNYIMVSMDAIQIFGLNAAVYCAELLNVFKKAFIKRKLIDEEYFKIDRDFITSRTSLSVDEQLKCDINLSKVDVIKIHEDNPDVIRFDIETYASLLSSEDVKILESVSKKVKDAHPKGSKKASREHVINSIKDSIECNDPDVRKGLEGWIDSIFGSGKGMSKIQVKYFKEKLDDYCDGNKPVAMKLLEIATIHSYIDCQWAINTYERDVRKVPINRRPLVNNDATLASQKTTTEIGAEIY